MDEILKLIESVFEGFPTYTCILVILKPPKHRNVTGEFLLFLVLPSVQLGYPYSDVTVCILFWIMPVVQDGVLSFNISY